MLNKHLTGWMFIASRDGAMSIYHFMRAMEATKACVHRCHKLKDMYDLNVAKKATRLFSATFPNWESMRHAVSHQADNAKSPEEMKSNSISGNFEIGGFSLNSDGQAYLPNCLSGRDYTTTINGKIISYALSHESYQSLLQIKHLFRSAFQTDIPFT